MKTVKIVQKINGINVHTELANPQAKKGNIRNGIDILDIVNVPDEVDNIEVIRLFDLSAPKSSYDVVNHQYEYNKLGAGRLI